MEPEIWKEKVTQLEILLAKGWNIPFNKRMHLMKSPTSKLVWLYKNLGEKNFSNPQYNNVMSILKELVG